MAMMVHDTQITLSTCVSLLRRLLVPLDRLLVVHIHALALIVHDTQIKLSQYVSLLRRPLPQPHHLVHLPLLPTTQRTPRSIALLHSPRDRDVYRARVVEHLLRAVRQLRAAHRTRLLHAPVPQLLHARPVEAVRAVEDLRRAELGIVEVLHTDGALIILVAWLLLGFRASARARIAAFFHRPPLRRCRCAALLLRHAVLLVPALLPVVLLAYHAAVVR